MGQGVGDEVEPVGVMREGGKQFIPAPPVHEQPHVHVPLAEELEEQIRLGRLAAEFQRSVIGDNEDAGGDV